MEGLYYFFQEMYTLASSATTLALMTLSGTLGIIIGSLPGLSATMGIALLTGLTYSVDKIHAMTILMGVYVGAIYGGSISAILINVPGTGSAAATALDGYPLAVRGEAASAITVTRTASIIGTFIGMIALVTITPLLTSLALHFTSAEYFLLALFGVLICGSVSARDLPVKGWIAGIIGVLLSMVGLESIQAVPRFTFGIVDLMGGISLIPAMIGFFAFPQIIKALKDGGMTNYKIAETSKPETSCLQMMVRNIGLIIRSSLIGVGVGALPGVGENVAAWLAYDNAKRTSKNGSNFGKGEYEGVIAPEVANNAAIGGAIIPTLSLAIPGSPPTAVLLGALLLHGIRPGPLLSQEFPLFTYQLSAMLMLSCIMLWLVGLVITKPMTRILLIPNSILMPIVSVLCVIGAYSLNLSSFDLVILFVFGIIGYALEELGYPSAAIILGFLLGGLLDVNLRRALIVSQGDVSQFFTRPICLIFVIAILYTFIGPYISRRIRGKFREITENAAD